jgi:hypothetical protein
MGTICPKFSSLGRDTIVIVESMSKHGHPGFGGTSLDDVYAELPHVGHRREILNGLIGRNKLCNKMATTTLS